MRSLRNSSIYPALDMPGESNCVTGYPFGVVAGEIDTVRRFAMLTASVGPNHVTFLLKKEKVIADSQVNIRVPVLL